MFAYVVIIKMANNNKVIIIVLYFSSHYTKCTMKTETTQRNNAERCVALQIFVANHPA